MLNTENFDSIQLNEMDQVKLMSRTDTKYWFHISKLQHILDSVSKDYFMLHINNECKLPYATTYYDSEADRMFTTHQNGKLNRYKVRRRSYVTSNISFLEVKFKTNKGKTQKKRIPAEYGNILFTEDENKFLQNNAPYSGNELAPSLNNNFSRITLVNRNFKERCTIDFELKFKHGDRDISLDEMVIVEIKSEGKSAISPLALALRDNRIKKSGFSKYCVGRTVTDSSIKRNNFKRKIRQVEKITNQDNLYTY